MMTWDEQSKAVREKLEDLFNEHPEFFRPDDMAPCNCDDPEHSHDNDPGSFIVTGAVLMIQQRNLDGHEVTCIFNWPADMGRVQKVGLTQTALWRLR
jgi:hypothetical protein